MLYKISFSKNGFFIFLVILTMSITHSLSAQQVSDPHVDSFSLLNATTGQTLVIYPNNTEVNTASIDVEMASNISVKFNTSNANSVLISGLDLPSRVENQLPFSLLGDQGT